MTVPRIHGVYEIRNIITQDVYIGSSASKRGIHDRWNNHLSLLRKNKHHSPILQNAWNKYKEENFTFKVLEQCVPQKCIELEQHYFDLVKPKYNATKIAKSRLGSKSSVLRGKPSEIEIAAFIKRNKDNRYWETNVKKAWASNKGRKHSEEELKKRGNAIKAKIEKDGINPNSLKALEKRWEQLKNTPLTDERKQYLSDISKKKRVWVLDKTTNVEYSFLSCKKLAQFFDCNYGSMMVTFKRYGKYRNLVLKGFV